MKVNDKDYNVIRLLGKGKGGYSYLATDKENEYVIKQIHHEPCSYYQFGNKIESELHDYKVLKDIGIPIPILIDVDLNKERLLKEYISGETMYDIILRDEVKKDHLQQIKDMCNILYKKKINIDYFPTNFIVHDSKLYYIDYECNAYMEEWNFENWGQKYWSHTKEFLAYVKEHK